MEQSSHLPRHSPPQLLALTLELLVSAFLETSVPTHMGVYSLLRGAMSVYSRFVDGPCPWGRDTASYKGFKVGSEPQPRFPDLFTDSHFLQQLSHLMFQLDLIKSNPGMNIRAQRDDVSKVLSVTLTDNNSFLDKTGTGGRQRDNNGGWALQVEGDTLCKPCHLLKGPTSLSVLWRPFLLSFVLRHPVKHLPLEQRGLELLPILHPTPAPSPPQTKPHRGTNAWGYTRAMQLGQRNLQFKKFPDDC